MAATKIEPFAIPTREAARVSGFSVRSLQQLTKDGKIPAAREHGRTYVYVLDELRDWVRNLPKPGSN